MRRFPIDMPVHRDPPEQSFGSQVAAGGSAPPADPFGAHEKRGPAVRPHVPDGGRCFQNPGEGAAPASGHGVFGAGRKGPLGVFGIDDLCPGVPPGGCSGLPVSRSPAHVRVDACSAGGRPVPGPAASGPPGRPDDAAVRASLPGQPPGGDPGIGHGYHIFSTIGRRRTGRSFLSTS